MRLMRATRGGVRARVRFWKRRLMVISGLQMAILSYSVFLALTVMVMMVVFQVITNGDILNLSPKETYWLGLGIVAFVFSIVVCFGLVLTNKIAGPIYRLKAHMEEVANSDSVRKITFRKGDFFSELVKPYNSILEKLPKQK